MINNGKLKLNIFHLSPFPYHSGGIDTWLYQFLKYNSNFQIKLFCPKANKNQNEKIFDINKIKNIHIYYLQNWNNLFTMILWSFKSILIIRNKVYSKSKNIVLSTIPTLIPVIVLKKINILKGEVICSVRGCIVKDAVDLKKSILFIKTIYFVEKLLLRNVDKIICNGWDTKEYILKYYKKMAIVIPNAINIKDSRNIQSYGNDDGYSKLYKIKYDNLKIVMHIGTIRSIKGILDILEAARILTNRIRDDVIFVFIGKGNYKRYKQIADLYKVKNIFMGEKKNVFSYIKLADIIINVSGGCGISNSLLESLYLGKIIVAWNKKTFNQIIKNGVNGYLAEDKNHNDLAMKIDDALKNIKRLDVKRIKDSVSKYNWDAINNDWRKIIMK